MRITVPTTSSHDKHQHSFAWMLLQNDIEVWRYRMCCHVIYSIQMYPELIATTYNAPNLAEWVCMVAFRFAWNMILCFVVDVDETHIEYTLARFIYECYPCLSKYFMFAFSMFLEWGWRMEKCMFPMLCSCRSCIRCLHTFIGLLDRVDGPLT